MSRIIDPSIFISIVFMTASISNPYIILYILAIKELRVTCLYFIKDLCIIFALLMALVKQISKAIYNNMSLLLRNVEFIKTITCSVF